MLQERKHRIFRTTIAGQALIEGICLAGPDKRVMVVRKSNGELETCVEPYAPLERRYPLLNLPFLRGCSHVFQSVYHSICALLWSSKFSNESPKRCKASEGFWQSLFSPTFIEYSLSFLTLLFGIGLSFVFFVYLPNYSTHFFLQFLPHAPFYVHTLLEALCKFLIFALYLLLCSKISDIERTLSYHGAEHKAIICYEKGYTLDIPTVKRMSRFHPRCQTSFFFFLLILSMLSSSILFDLPAVQSITCNSFLRLGLHLFLLPVVVALAYELNHIIGRYDSPLTRTLRKPSFLLQRLTTREPDEGMIELAIHALKLVLPETKGEDRWV